MRVAIDATPLIGIRTGIGVFLEGLLDSLNEFGQKEDAIEIAEYTLSFSARLRGYTRGTWVLLPAAQAPVIWKMFNAPKVERLLGEIDLVHGTNYVVPAPTAPQLLTVHDLSFLDNRFCRDKIRAQASVFCQQRRSSWRHYPHDLQLCRRRNSL